MDKEKARRKPTELELFINKTVLLCQGDRNCESSSFFMGVVQSIDFDKNTGVYHILFQDGTSHLLRKGISRLTVLD